ncbi:hypothetical protein GUITHDRAFT_161832 [Guillardia theta CCMP2712]|uniref:Alpha-type protein kinase domain-containing protein n=1 Tax=Guillardia theta (strain CCMP2712) TaxID=905079 RepID=L1JR65_GUITC|nr:hypothetical protein GUITHDRAFT_161832 [Guillardia theta CCMP2712]EKX50588.1 hypothetical protein GUITHDRAFT_161832 [Guillardia theta CCMP2712]|eukprot:XP_005837568.1 hypothetical protein GUITHDRAFT_161832 [Guillardia theta CCMP2712]
MASSAKERLREAMKHGRYEYANPGRDGQARLRVFHKGQVFLTDHSGKNLICSWRINGEEEREAEVLDSGATHTVIVVDHSGSMRKNDVLGYESRISAVYDCLIRDHIQPRVELLRGKGPLQEKHVISLVHMSTEPTIVLRRHPINEELIPMIRATISSPRCHGHYVPALDAVLELLKLSRGSKEKLFLFFLSDGVPSDHVDRVCCHGVFVWKSIPSHYTSKPSLRRCPGNARCRRAVVEEVTSECLDKMMMIGDIYGRDRVFVCTVAFGPSNEDYEVLEKMSKVLPNSSFQKLGLSSNCLRTAFSSLTSTVTSLCNELAGASLSNRNVERDTSDRGAASTDTVDLRRGWDLYVVRPAGRTSGAGENMTITAKYKWNFTTKSLEPGGGLVTRQGPRLVAKSSIYMELANTLKDILPSFHVQSDAHAMSVLFNRRLQGPAAWNIHFIPCFAYELRDDSFKDGVAWVYVEEELEGNFVKWNNNNGFVRRSRKAKECLVCGDNPRQIRLSCGHAIFCLECLRNFQVEHDKCPVCRKTIEPHKNKLLDASSSRDSSTYVAPAADRGLGAILEEAEDEEEEEDEGEAVLTHEHDNEVICVDDLPQCFSHFTYQVSDGHTLVCDLQGVWNPVDGFLLTDPAIHTDKKLDGWKHRSNKRQEGIKTFFQSHTCNIFCRKLGLKMPNL